MIKSMADSAYFVYNYSRNTTMVVWRVQWAFFLDLPPVSKTEGDAAGNLNRPSLNFC